MYGQNWQTATFDGFRLPFFGSNGYQSTSKPTPNLCFSILQSWSRLKTSILNTFVRVEHVYAPNIGIQIHFMVFGYFFWLKRIPIHKLTPNLCFNIHFHLYIHDHALEQAFWTLFFRGEHVCTPNKLLVYSYILWFSATFSWHKQIPFHKLTQNLHLNIPFNLYIHDQDLQQAIGAVTCGMKSYVPPILAYSYILWFSVTFFGSNEYQSMN